MEHPVTAIYDANILYPAPLRDLFIRLAQAGLVRARWTETIHDEWLGNVLNDNPRLAPERLARTRMLMNEAIRDCLVTGYEDLIESLSLPDPDDRHVLAAAICGGAGVIVTFNLNDFPSSILSRFDIEAIHPDDFVVSLLDQAPDLVCGAVRRQRESLRNPPRTTEELLATLERQGAPSSSRESPAIRRATLRANQPFQPSATSCAWAWLKRRPDTPAPPPRQPRAPWGDWGGVPDDALVRTPSATDNSAA